MNVRIVFKLVITVISCIFLMLAIGFSFDSGTGIEIAGRIIVALAFFALFVSALWRNEISSEPGGITKKKIILWTAGIFVLFFIRGCGTCVTVSPMT